MRLLSSLLCLLVILHCSYAPPVNPDNKDSEVKDDLEEYMEYHRYLKEVVQALESDPDFRERLEKADEEDVRSGKIAEHLDFVNHNVRTKLDEIKRRELERLRHLATKQFELNNNLDMDSGKVATNEHLDHLNPHTFEIEDLKKLILKTTADLEAADKQRKEEFKEYEMQKEFDKHKKLETMDETQKKVYMDKLKEEEDAKKHHKPLHHPVTKEQLLETWENADKMDAKDFNPRVFFMMHDVDGNGVWDADEVKALFIKELDKMYGPGGPNKDLHERAEEMERMREHVFKENDRNRDGLIDFNEFMLETQKAEFNKDEGWKSIDENQIYTQAEYEEFEKRRLEEIQYLKQRGLIDAHGRPVPGAQHQLQAYQQQQQHHQAYLQQQAYQHQQLQQPQYQGQPSQYPHGVPQHQQGVPVNQGLPSQGQYQPAQGQYQPLQDQYQHPQGQYQGVPQGQFQAPPQGQFQGPPQGQFQASSQAQYQAPPQGQQAQYQAPPQGQQAQYQAPPQGQQTQGQAPQAAQNLNTNLGQAPPVPQAQAPSQAAPPQNAAPVAAAVPGQNAQGQGQPQAQGQAPPQAQNKVPADNNN